MSQAAAPRENLLDVTRGFAVCGILLMNITVMGASLYAPPPQAPPALADPQWQAFLIEQLFLEGRMRGLFTLLFGASVLLLIRNYEHSQTPSPADLHYRRAFGLMVLGLVNAHLFLWYSDILFLYGWCALLLFPLRNLSWRWLMALGALLTIALAGFGAARQALHLAQAAASPAAVGPTPAMLAAESQARLGGFIDIVRFHYPVWESFFAGRGFFVHLAEALSFMLIGMALLKLDVLNGKRPAYVYASLAAIGLGLGIGLSALDMALAWRTSFAPNQFTPGAITYQFSRLFGALGYIGLLGLIWRGAVSDPIGLGLQALGRMALTNYLGHSIICALLFYGVGLRLYGHFTTYGLWEIAVLILLVQAVFCILWLRAFRLGPTEWVLRSISHWRLQPLRSAPRKPVTAHAV